MEFINDKLEDIENGVLFVQADVFEDSFNSNLLRKFPKVLNQMKQIQKLYSEEHLSGYLQTIKIDSNIMVFVSFTQTTIQEQTITDVETLLHNIIISLKIAEKNNKKLYLKEYINDVSDKIWQWLLNELSWYSNNLVICSKT